MATKLSDFYRGDTRTYTLEFHKAGTPVDISGWEFFFTMKSDKELTDATAELQVRTVMGNDTDTQNGIGTFTLTSDQTDLLEPGVYFYDLQRVVAGTPPVVKTIMNGKIKVLEDITRDKV